MVLNKENIIKEIKKLKKKKKKRRSKQLVTDTSPGPRGNYITKTKTKYPTASNNDNKTAGNYHIIHTSRKKPKTLSLSLSLEN